MLSRTARGEERKHSGGTLTIHFRLMWDATLELLSKIKYSEKPDMS